MVRIDYAELRARVAQASLDVIGKSVWDAALICSKADLKCRVVSVDGQGAMIIADCRMDRIGLVVNHGIVTSTRNG